MRPSRTLIRFCIAGMLVGLLAVLLFGAIHALTIVPIWDRLSGGIPFCIAAGTVIGWARFELRETSYLPAGIVAGAWFGFLIWLTLVPMTIFGLIVRAAGIHGTDNNWEVITASTLTFCTGAFCGWLLTKNRRATLSLGAAGLLLALAQAGPIALLNSARAAWLFVTLAVVYVLSGLLLELTQRLLRRRIAFRQDRGIAGNSKISGT